MNQLSNSLILVDAEDREIGPLEKVLCHDGSGQRHRAFSLFLFDDQGRLLIQKRSDSKRLWPGFWANSCCSHPRWGETILTAAARRPLEELGIPVWDLKFIYKFEYQASFGEKGSEWELCHVLFGRLQEAIKPNAGEVADWQFVQAEELTRALASQKERFTPWLQLEWEEINTRFTSELSRYTQPVKERCGAQD